MENKTETPEKKIPLWRQKIDIPIEVISDLVGDVEQMHKYSFPRHYRRMMEAMQRKDPSETRKFKERLSKENDKQAHRTAVLRKQKEAHQRSLARKQVKTNA